MIPFLKHSKEASVSGPVETIKREPDEEAEFDPLESAGQDLIDAVKAGDAKAAAAALRAAFELAGSDPLEGDQIG